MSAYNDPTRSTFGNHIPVFPDRAVAITPSDTTDQGREFTVYAGGGGDVAIIPAGQEADAPVVVFSAVPAGGVVPCLARRVMATNTTASGLVGVY